MTSTFSRRAGAPLALLAIALAGCGGLQVTENFLGVITPYRIEVACLSHELTLPQPREAISRINLAAPCICA